jgi:hypothetical protein
MPGHPQPDGFGEIAGLEAGRVVVEYVEPVAAEIVLHNDRRRRYVRQRDVDGRRDLRRIAVSQCGNFRNRFNGA